jgi:hypothetical protein
VPSYEISILILISYLYRINSTPKPAYAMASYFSMGNISNIWYLKDGGGSWSDTKCELDVCYNIPYNAAEDTNLFLQADIPEGYTVEEVWLCDMTGFRLQELLAITEWRTIFNDDIRKFIFKFPNDSYACNGSPCTICTATMDEPGNESWYADYMAGVNNVQVTLIEISTATNWNVTSLGAPLPAGWVRLAKDKFQVPCDLATAPPAWNIQFITDDPGGNHTQGWPQNVEEEEAEGCTPLDCFYLEIPLIQDEEEQATLASEPFECVNCIPTVAISSDYCLSPTDIYGTFLFGLTGYDGDVAGSLTAALNNFRIQAVLKSLPAQLSTSRNVKCNNFRSKLQERYKLQGAMPIDFPDYIVNIVQSIFSGKTTYINGDAYIRTSEQIFQERNVAGRSMYKLDMALEKCEKSIPFDCSCVVEPVDCEENPIEYAGIVLMISLPFTQYGQDNNIVDETYWLIEIDPSQLSGGTPPYNIGSWGTNLGHLVPNSDFITFDPAGASNIWRRPNTGPHMQASTESGLVVITDDNGCELDLGNSVNLPDMRCAGYAATFVVDNITNSSFQITSITTEFGLNAFDCFDISIDSLSGGYSTTGIPVGSLPHTVVGLAPDTEYGVVIRVWCECPLDPDNPIGEESGQIGPMIVTTQL